MSELQRKIDWINMFRGRPGTKPPMSHPLSDDDVKDVVDHISGDLSPENLHCDGEISPAQAARKAQALHAAYDELRERYPLAPELNY